MTETQSPSILPLTDMRVYLRVGETGGIELCFYDNEGQCHIVPVSRARALRLIGKLAEFLREGEA